MLSKIFRTVGQSAYDHIICKMLPMDLFSAVFPRYVRYKSAPLIPLLGFSCVTNSLLTYKRKNLLTYIAESVFTG